VTRRIQSNELASAEFEAAVRWYEERRRGLGVEFFDAVSLTMALVAERSEIGTLISGSTRRVVVSRFPYQVVYHLSPADITIVAVAHLKRRPDYWKTRY
jgi:plasmid stabilization system protein ParE